MQYRRHYKCVGEKGLNPKVAPDLWDKITEEAIVEYQEPSSDPLTPE